MITHKDAIEKFGEGPEEFAEAHPRKVATDKIILTTDGMKVTYPLTGDWKIDHDDAPLDESALEWGKVTPGGLGEPSLPITVGMQVNDQTTQPPAVLSDSLETKGRKTIGYYDEYGKPHLLPETQSTPVSIAMQAMQRFASDPECDPCRMKAILEVYERIEAREAERQFNIALRKAQAEMPRLIKDAVNTATRSKYVRFETMGDAIDPVAYRNGFSESYSTEPSHLEGHYRVICHLSHDAGHTRSYHVDMPLDNQGMKGMATKTATHGFGSTVTYGKRYLKAMIWNLVIANEDDDGNGHSNDSKVITDGQAFEIELLLRTTGRSLDKFLAFKKIRSVKEIPARDYERATAEITNMARRATEKAIKQHEAENGK